jgi:hypothetical protein
MYYNFQSAFARKVLVFGVCVIFHLRFLQSRIFPDLSLPQIISRTKRHTPVHCGTLRIYYFYAIALLKTFVSAALTNKFFRTKYVHDSSILPPNVVKYSKTFTRRREKCEKSS